MLIPSSSAANLGARLTAILLLSAMIWVGCGDGNGDDGPADVQLVDRLVFSIHVDLLSQYDLADLLRALEDARAAFQGSQGSRDVACCTQIEAIALDVFGTPGDGLDVIDSEAKWNQLGSMKALVLDITWPQPSCGVGKRPGNRMAVALDCGDAGHIIAHERGHNAGLNHREDDSCQPLMHGAGGHGGCLKISECRALRRLGASDGVCTCLGPSLGGPPLPDGAACTLDAEVGVCRAGGVCIEGAVLEAVKLLASDGAAGDSFGRVAVAGDTAVVGARSHGESGLDIGAAYVFQYDGTAWVEEAEITASDGAADDRFGTNVAIDGNRVVVAAPGADYNGINSGAAYVFYHDGTGWVEEAKLTASDGAENGFFSVALDGNTVVVGAYGADDNGSNSGAAYVFYYDGTAWVEEAKLTASDGAADDLFGRSVAVAGDTVVVGARSHGDSGLDIGAAYVFRYNGTAWVEEAELTASDGAAGDFFGVSIAVDADTTVVGAWGHDDNRHTSSGAAYVFHYDGTAWVEEARLTASDAADHDRFGWSVAVASDTVVVGARWDDDYGVDSGAAYVFRYDGTAWVEEAKLTALDAADHDLFGRWVAVDGNTVVVGAYGADDNGSDSGAAYVFRLPEPSL